MCSCQQNSSATHRSLTHTQGRKGQLLTGGWFEPHKEVLGGSNTCPKFCNFEIRIANISCDDLWSSCCNLWFLFSLSLTQYVIRGGGGEEKKRGLNEIARSIGTTKSYNMPSTILEDGTQWWAEWHGPRYGLNCVPLKSRCWSPNPQLGMWLYSDIGPLKRWSSYSKSVRVGSNPIWQVFL